MRHCYKPSSPSSFLTLPSSLLSSHCHRHKSHHEEPLQECSVTKEDVEEIWKVTLLIITIISITITITITIIIIIIIMVIISNEEATACSSSGGGGRPSLYGALGRSRHNGDDDVDVKVDDD